MSYTANVEDLYPFHQQLLTLTEGRFFTQAEYDAKAKVCIVSEKTAGMLGLKLGDTLPFTVNHSSGDVFDPDSQTLVDEGDYEIVGITKRPDTRANADSHPRPRAPPARILPTLSSSAHVCSGR